MTDKIETTDGIYEGHPPWDTEPTTNSPVNDKTAEKLENYKWLTGVLFVVVAFSWLLVGMLIWGGANDVNISNREGQILVVEGDGDYHWTTEAELHSKAGHTNE